MTILKGWVHWGGYRLGRGGTGPCFETYLIRLLAIALCYFVGDAVGGTIRTFTILFYINFSGVLSAFQRDGVSAIVYFDIVSIIYLGSYPAILVFYRFFATWGLLASGCYYYVV